MKIFPELRVSVSTFSRMKGNTLQGYKAMTVLAGGVDVIVGSYAAAAS